MESRRIRRFSAPFLVLLGVGLFTLAAVHHLTEVARLGHVAGPLFALFIDGLPALALAYGGYWVSTHEFTPGQESRMFVWCVTGALLWVSVMGISMGVRAIEGRQLSEPLFELILAADAGALAGFVAGFYNTQARQDARRAERATDALSFVNAVLRHDIKNDLTVVRSNAVLIEAKTEDAAEVDEHAETIQEKVDEATELVNSTGVIAETLTEAAPLNPVDLTDIVADSVERLEDVHDVSVTETLPGSAVVTGNKGLRSVVDNLLENAVEHSDRDEPRVTVSVTTGPERVELRVSDNGPGVPEEEKESLFEADENGGHGGGLYLVQTLVSAYGGSIRVEDNEPRGAVFVVELPRANVGNS